MPSKSVFKAATFDPGGECRQERHSLVENAPFKMSPKIKDFLLFPGCFFAVNRTVIYEN